MNNIQKEEILKYLKSIKNDLNSNGIERIGLFGSFAKDNVDLASDIDILLKTNEEFLKKYQGIKAFLYLEELRSKISKKFHRRVDICYESGMKNKIDEVIYA